MDRAAIGLGSVFLHLRAEINWSRLFHGLIEGFDAEAVESNVGTVIVTGDGIAQIHGLGECMVSELLEFDVRPIPRYGFWRPSTPPHSPPLFYGAALGPIL